MGRRVWAYTLNCEPNELLCPGCFVKKFWHKTSKR